MSLWIISPSSLRERLRACSGLRPRLPPRAVVL